MATLPLGPDTCWISENCYKLSYYSFFHIRNTKCTCKVAIATEETLELTLKLVLRVTDTISLACTSMYMYTYLELTSTHFASLTCWITGISGK